VNVFIYTIPMLLAQIYIKNIHIYGSIWIRMMYIYICIYIYTYIHIYIYTYIYNQKYRLKKVLSMGSVDWGLVTPYMHDAYYECLDTYIIKYRFMYIYITHIHKYIYN
jgi:hypothetical protein